MPGRYAQQKHREHFYKYTPPHKGDYEKIYHYRRRHCHHTYKTFSKKSLTKNNHLDKNLEKKEEKPEKKEETEKSYP